MLRDRIAAFIADPAAGTFEELALDAFRFQVERIEPYRRLCARRGIAADRVSDWRRIPPVPTSAFKTLELAAGEPGEVFRSSGTTQGVRSVHRHAFPDLYRAVIDATFPDACLEGLEQPPMLSLVPDRQQAPDSSLSFMMEHVLQRFGAPDSVVAVGRQGVAASRVRGFLAARQRDRRPVVLLATSFALIDLLEGLQRLGLHFRLPSGSRIFETGGYKGRSRTVHREELLRQIGQRLAVPPTAVVREYGMTELTSHFYTRVLAQGDPDVFFTTHWTRVRVLDPVSLTEAEPGAPGLLAILDLANLGSAVHLLTEDIGWSDGDGFRLTGRAAGAELRGCSLMAEEMAAPAG